LLWLYLGLFCRPLPLLASQRCGGFYLTSAPTLSDSAKSRLSAAQQPCLKGRNHSVPKCGEIFDRSVSIFMVTSTRSKARERFETRKGHERALSARNNPALVAILLLFIAPPAQP
jgi:hypothetical protein